MAIRTKLRDRKLPDYTRGEEIFHMVSHIVGGGLAIAATLVCFGVAIWKRDLWIAGSSLIYGAAMIVMYIMSSIYHGLVPKGAKKVFQILDHCAIYFLIAGTYTPFAMVPLRVAHPKIGWGLFVAVWCVCAIGTALTAIDLRKFRVFAMICYLGLGWSLLVFSRQLLEALPLSAFAFLVGGGVSYTIGSVIYMLGKKRRHMHSVFHLFVVLGSALHFLSILMCFINV